MNVVGMHRRIRKLESSIPGGISAWTSDELCVRILELSKTAVVETFSAEEREQLEEAIADIEDDMIRLAAKQASSDYAKHLEWCRKMWRVRSKTSKYEPALTGADGGMGEYQDWDKPELMARRRALRDNLTVKEVLARPALMKQVQEQASGRRLRPRQPVT